MTISELELDTALKDELIRDMAAERFIKISKWFGLANETWAEKAERLGVPYEVVSTMGEQLSLLSDLMHSHD
jgi:hypothetical protein